MRSVFRRGKWINKNNKYRVNCLDALKNALNNQHILQYIAASVPLHCSDGWNFLGRSVDSIKNGDPFIACHLAYYAELRAAMSLLGSQGIGIFSSDHVIIDTLGNCSKISPRGNRAASGTHKFAWVALQHWGEQQRSADLIGDIIRPGNFPLKIWLSAFSTGTIQPIAAKWLNTWGLDLKRVYEDQYLRNDSSYRPNHISLLPNSDAVKICAFIRSFWSCFEPSGTFEFNTLDKHLLRLSLEAQFQAFTGDSPGDNHADFLARVTRMLELLGITGVMKSNYENFFGRISSPTDPAIINYSNKVGSIEDPDFHLQVLSRAALLLRLANGSVAKSLSSNGVNRGDLSFWANTLGEARGFWPLSTPPVDFSELWDDVAEACEVLEDWESNVASGTAENSMISLLSSENISALATVGGFEKIALWGFC